MSNSLDGLAIVGYRSFGDVPQYFPTFRKVNIFIGQNNSGKSNVLRFISEVLPQWERAEVRTSDPQFGHLGSAAKTAFAIAVKPSDLIEHVLSNSKKHWFSFGFHHPARNHSSAARKLTSKVVSSQVKCVEGVDLVWNYFEPGAPESGFRQWMAALQELKPRYGRHLLRLLGTVENSTDSQTNIRNLAKLFRMTPPSLKVCSVPAYRSIGCAGSRGSQFDGGDLIDSLAKLQNPGFSDRALHGKFLSLRGFFRTVLDDHSIEIEVPYERNTILVHWGHRTLPVESLGTGIHQVLILAAACTVASDCLVCIEEPESHINPTFQRKLLSYLIEETENQYFVSTHSPAFLNRVGAEVYHLRLVDGSSLVSRVSTDRCHSNACEDLGYKPSDLMLANCIVWVEGPSDAIYVKWWLAAVDPGLDCDVHYSIMFYGGKLAAHLQFQDGSSASMTLISLKALNPRCAIVMDSDKSSPTKRINQTKRRLREEFKSGGGLCWITSGREIENHVDLSQLKDALAAVVPGAVTSWTPGDHYQSLMRLASRNGSEANVPKVEVARHIAGKFTPDLSLLDLRSRVEELASYIRIANGKSATTRLASHSFT